MPSSNKILAVNSLQNQSVIEGASEANARGTAAMALSDLTRNSVLQALVEFDELGRDAFLDRYHFGKARTLTRLMARRH